MAPGANCDTGFGRGCHQFEEASGTRVELGNWLVWFYPYTASRTDEVIVFVLVVSTEVLDEVERSGRITFERVQ